MKNKLLLSVATFLCLMAGRAQAQNPIIRDQFSADPTARVFDGKIYLYPSHDIPSPIERLKEWFCMADYHVFSSDDLAHWEDHGVIVSQERIPWARPDAYSMWAPDCVCKDGKYYFYFPATPRGVEKGFAVGVAVSDKPSGPFMPQMRPIEGVDGIDPCVLTDKDGQSYIYWAGRGMMMAKLKDNMVELDGEMKEMEGLEDFHEATWIHKYNGKYYLSYSDNHDENWNDGVKGDNRMRYAISDNPLGPWKSMGIYMEPTDSYTNHGSIVEYKGQWFAFYHNSALSNHDWLRSICVDKLYYNEDGTIQMVKQRK